MASSEEQPALKRARTGAASDEVQAALERALAAMQEEAGHMPEVATFVVGGRKFQILEQTIKSRGQTMLSDLLSEPSRKDKEEPIYVEGDGDRFRHILDWYRFGSIKLPSSLSLDEMKRECAFYGLPEDVRIEPEDVGLVLRTAHATREKVQKAAAGRWLQPAASAAARAAIQLLLADDAFWRTGSATHTYASQSKQQKTDGTACWVHNALQHLPKADFIKELKAEADQYGFKAAVGLENQGYGVYTISLSLPSTP